MARLPAPDLAGTPNRGRRREPCAHLGFDHHLLDLLGRDADRAIERDAGTGEERGEEIALVGLDGVDEAAGLQRAAAFAGDDEREIFASVLVAVFEAGAPHHHAVVEQRAVAVARGFQAVDIVGEERDVEGVDL